MAQIQRVQNYTLYQVFAAEDVKTPGASALTALQLARRFLILYAVQLSYGLLKPSNQTRWFRHTTIGCTLRHGEVARAVVSRHQFVSS